jgi:hypothetical protein
MAAYRIWRAWVTFFLAGYFALGLSALALLVSGRVLRGL